jgi:hypothetical protein
MRHAKTIVIAVLLLLAVTVVLQNREVTQLRVLFVTLTMSRAAMLFTTLALGIVIGLLGAMRVGGKKPKS